MVLEWWMYLFFPIPIPVFVAAFVAWCIIDYRRHFPRDHASRKGRL